MASSGLMSCLPNPCPTRMPLNSLNPFSVAHDRSEAGVNRKEHEAVSPDMLGPRSPKLSVGLFF